MEVQLATKEELALALKQKAIKVPITDPVRLERRRKNHRRAEIARLTAERVSNICVLCIRLKTNPC